LLIINYKHLVSDVVQSIMIRCGLKLGLKPMQRTHADNHWFKNLNYIFSSLFSHSKLDINVTQLLFKQERRSRNVLALTPKIINPSTERHSQVKKRETDICIFLTLNKPLFQN